MRIIGVLGVLLVGVALIGRPPTASAQPLELKLDHVGVVVAPDEGPVRPPLGGNLAGSRSVGPPVFTIEGTQLQGLYCRQFGIQFHATNLPAGETTLVQIRLDHPLWTREDGATGTTETWPGALTGDTPAYAGYTLEERWSLVPGPWTFTISQAGRELLKTTITLDVKPGQTAPTDGCISATS